MIANSIVSSKSVVTSILPNQSGKQTAAQEADFARILERARRGETLTTQEIASWERHRDSSGKPCTEPDEVDEAGLISGFQPTFPGVFPSALKERLEKMWTHCQSSDEKFKFMEMFQLNFEADPGKAFIRYNDNSWRDSIKAGIDYGKSIISTSVGEEKANESSMINLLQQLLN